MGHIHATRVGLNTRVKSLVGIPYRTLVERSWDMSAEDFWNYQSDAFNSIYSFARERVPYYQNHLEDYPSVSSQNGNVLDVLSKLPVLKKQIVRKSNLELYPSPLLPLTFFHTTSGTSGTPLRLATTLSEKGLGQVIGEEWRRRICGSRNPRTLFLSGFMTPSPSSKEICWIDQLSGDVYLSIYSLEARNRDKIIDLINYTQPQMIYGYSSSVHELAVLVGEDLQASKANRIAAVTSEVLQPQWRSDIEVFCQKVYDFYSSQECCHIVVQCSQDKMHICPIAGIVEIVDEFDQPVQEGELGRVLVTGLIRRSMPLIRYEIGDCAVSTGYDSTCSCGLHWPTIGRIEGRVENLVKTRDGRKIGMLGYSVLKDLKGVKESQIVQLDYERFACNIVKNENESVDNELIETAIRAQLQKRLQVNVDITFNYLPSVPRGARGKFSAVLVNF